MDLRCGDCRDLLKALPDASVDAIITDPPYAEIDRPYGRLSEAEWHALMRDVIAEARRVLRPTGSAVFILQPNYETPGRMRPWLWEFMAWTAREWGQVQDAWWWNLNALPTAGCQRQYGLMRSSLKPCVWLGAANCYRNQGAVLWEESDHNKARRAAGRLSNERKPCPSGKPNKEASLRMAAGERGGTTPFNVLPIAPSRGDRSGTTFGHSAPTPTELADWWVRYISPEGGIVCDPFMGSGTIPLAALARGRSVIGFEQMPEYFAIASKRIADAQAKCPLPLIA